MPHLCVINAFVRGWLASWGPEGAFLLVAVGAVWQVENQCRCISGSVIGSVIGWNLSEQIRAVTTGDVLNLLLAQWQPGHRLLLSPVYTVHCRLYSVYSVHKVVQCSVAAIARRDPSYTELSLCCDCCSCLCWNLLLFQCPFTCLTVLTYVPLSLHLSQCPFTCLTVPTPTDIHDAFWARHEPTRQHDSMMSSSHRHFSSWDRSNLPPPDKICPAEMKLSSRRLNAFSINTLK